MSFNRKRRLKRPEITFTEQCGKGTVVRSMTGRSRGRLFVVTDVFIDKYGKLYAYVCDGERRTVSNPKLKAAAHLEVITVNTFTALTDEDAKGLTAKIGNLED